MPEENQPGPPHEPRISFSGTPGYRSDKVYGLHPSFWDCAPVVGTLRLTAPDAIEIADFRGDYASLQRAKAPKVVPVATLLKTKPPFGTLSFDAPQAALPMISPPAPRPVR